MMNPSNLHHGFLLTACFCAAGVSINPAEAQVLLRDDFDGSSLNTALWRIPNAGPGSFLGRTQLETAALPGVGGGIATLTLDTYNPTAAGSLFRGSEIITNSLYSRDNGLIFEARTRLVSPTAGGLIGSLFSYDVFGSIRDEIDFELVSNDVINNNDRILTNVFQDDPFTGPGSGGDSAFVAVPGIDLTQFNTYRIEWLPNRLDWYVNDVLVRTATNDLPDDPMSIRLNLWAPDPAFAVAYNPALQPTGSPGSNQEYRYEIDFVEIRRPDAPAFTNPGFEDFGGSLNGWGAFGDAIGNVSADSTVAFEGSNALKLFGQFNGGTNFSGVTQGIEIDGGDTVEAEVERFIRSQDSIAGTANTVEMKIEFYSVFGAEYNSAGFLGEEIQVIADGNSTEDVWENLGFQAIAPANAVEARLSFVFVQPSPNAPGAVFLDQAGIEVVQALLGDLDMDGDVDDADFGLAFAAFSGPGVASGNTVADLDNDGDVDDADFGIAFAAFTGPNAAANVPEPASALLLLAGAAAWLRRGVTNG